MAKHTGRNGKVSMGGNFLGGLTNWNVDESAENIDLSDADDDWTDGGTGIKSWTGEITLRLDFDAGANQTPRAGDVVALELYSEGDASGKTYYSGNAVITSHGVASPHDGATERTYSVEGRGALASSTVV